MRAALPTHPRAHACCPPAALALPCAALVLHRPVAAARSPVTSNTVGLQGVAHLTAAKAAAAPAAAGGVPLRGRTVTAAAAGQSGALGGGGSSGSSGGGGSGGGGSSGGSSGSSGDSSAPHPMRNWTWAYAAFLAAGGVFAYVKAKSTKSLSSALGASLILALSGRKMLLGSARGSIAVCLAISLFLAVIMAGRYSRSRKVMPAGVTAAASIGMSGAYILSLLA